MPLSSEPLAQTTVEDASRTSEAGARPRVAQDERRLTALGAQSARFASITRAALIADDRQSGKASAEPTRNVPETPPQDEAEVAPETTPGSGCRVRGEVGGSDSSSDALGSPPEIALVVGHDGTLEALYGERLDLSSLGSLTIRRASHVEPTPDGLWTADLSPVDGPVLGPFVKRSEALAAECRWIDTHVLS